MTDPGTEDTFTYHWTWTETAPDDTVTVQTFTSPVIEFDRVPENAYTLLLAVTEVADHDNRLDIAEAELIRVVCAALDCPLPPILNEAGPGQGAGQ